MRSNRGRSAETSTEENTVSDIETNPETTEAPATETPATGAETTTTARAPRPVLEVGEVQVRKSSRTDLKSRPSPTESNPVFLAVKAAEFDEATDLLVDSDKVENARKILRRAAQPDKLNVGMTIYPGTPDATDDDGNVIAGKVVLTFAKHAEKTRKAKGSDATPATTEV